MGDDCGAASHSLHSKLGACLTLTRLNELRCKIAQLMSRIGTSSRVLAISSKRCGPYLPPLKFARSLASFALYNKFFT